MKERLVGAAVLVAIAVWLIPWVLDGSDDPIDSTSNSLQLPAAEEPVAMRTQTLRLEGVAETPAVADTAAPAVDPVTPPPAAAVAEQPAAVAATAPPVETPAPKPSTQAATTPEPRGAAVAAPAAPRPVATPAAKGDWVVQLGSFGDEDNARRLAQRASTFGYKAGISSHRSGARPMYRVRVGPFASRGQADATASALTAHGLTGQVVAAD